MNIEVYMPRHQWSPASLAPEEPPVLDEDEAVVAEEMEQTDEEARELRAHGLEEYCEHSRRLGHHRGVRPAYIGYAVMPEDVRGVCHHSR